MNKKTLGKLLFLPALASAMFLTSCDENQGLVVTLPLAYSEIYLEVPPSPVVGSSNFDSIVVDNSELDSILATKNATKDDIQSIKLKSVKFTIVDSANHQIDTLANFNKLSSAQLFMKTSALPEIQVAAKNPVPSGVNPLDLDESTSDLAPYIKSNQFIIKAQGSTNAPILQKMFIKVQIEFEVEAEI